MALSAEPPLARDLPSSSTEPAMVAVASAAELKLNQVLLPIRSPPTVTLLSKSTTDAAPVLPLPYSEPEMFVPSATETQPPASTMTSPLTEPDTTPSLCTSPDIKRDQ